MVHANEYVSPLLLPHTICSRIKTGSPDREIGTNLLPLGSAREPAIIDLFGD